MGENITERKSNHFDSLKKNY